MFCTVALFQRSKACSKAAYNTLKQCYSMSSTSDLTKIEFCNGIKNITLCNQKTRNALSLNMMQNLIEAINNDKDNNELRVIVISAEGSVFSAGHNLKELTPEMGRKAQEKVFHVSTVLMNSIIDCPVPIIAKVDGLAAASGCQLVAQCDIAVCTDSSKFSTPGANFGIFCSTPGVALARCVNKMTAMHMLLTGIPISAQEAKSSGLVAKTCSNSTELDKEIETICEAIKSKSRSVIELGKRFYYKQIQLEVKKAYVVGGEKMVENLQLTDGKEGIKSFVEKRKPVWEN